MEGVRNRGICLLAGMTLLAALAVSQPAWGSTAASQPPTLLAGEGAGAEQNALSLYYNGVSMKYHVGESFINIAAQVGCVQMGSKDVECDTAQISDVAVFVHAGADSVSDNIDLPATIEGGDGNDILDGGPQGDRLDGELGNDQLFGDNGPDVLGDGGNFFGADGNDQVYGGNGNDTIEGGDIANTGKGADLLDGMANTDTLDYSLRTAPLTVFEGDGLANDGQSGEGDQVVNAEIIVLGSAADTAVGGAEPNTLDGRGGNDNLNGASGNDTLLGADGDDTLEGGPGGDSISGGTGLDRTGYAGRTNPVTVTIGDGPNDGEAGEGDNVMADVEDVTGGSSNDTMTGAGAADTLTGGPGADAVNGAAGDDTLRGEAGADAVDGGTGDDALDLGPDADQASGGTGDDSIEAADGSVDQIDCGTGNDTVNADEADEVAANCETVTRPAGQPQPPPPGGGDTTGPALGLPAKLKAHRKAVKVAVTCPAEETGGCLAGTLALSAASAPPPARIRYAKASKSFELAAGQTKKVKLKLRKGLLKRLRKTRKATLAATAGDAAGNVATTTATVPVKGLGR
jgi:Ca2+-binding RTX toxin-like protein